MASLKDEISGLRGELKKAKFTIDNTEPYDSKKQEDQTRSRLALIFVWGYFSILAGAIILVLVNNFLVAYLKIRTDIIINVKDIISAVSAAIGTSLGFVVGYYFKSSENNK